MRIRSGNILVIALFIFFAAFSAKAEIFTASLSGSQEVPANSSTATGYARVFVNEAAGTLTFTVVFNNLSSAQIASHIHAPAAIGANAPVTVNFGVVGGTSGTITGSTTVTPTQIAQLRAHQGYVNVHSSNFPGGELRGQLGSRRVLDYDGDGRTDYSVLRFPNVAPPGVAQITYWNRNSSGFAANQTILWGNANTDFPAPGDYDGDAKDDFALYRAGASAGQQSFYLILRSSDSTAQFIPWGVFGDANISRDFDGDGKTDPTVFRRGATAGAQTNWFTLRSSDGGVTQTAFGLTGNGTTTFDSPIPGDYDGDGKFDLAVYRFGLSPTNNYIVLRSSDNVVTFQPWGNFNTDYIAPGDFDGDGKFDLVAVRTGATAAAPLIWFIRRSSDNQVRVQQFGLSSDIPTQGDYDGDAVTDISVWRELANGTDSAFYTNGSFASNLIANNWGIDGDFVVNGFDAR